MLIFVSSLPPPLSPPSPSLPLSPPLQLASSRIKISCFFYLLPKLHVTVLPLNILWIWSDYTLLFIKKALWKSWILEHKLYFFKMCSTSFESFFQKFSQYHIKLLFSYFFQTILVSASILDLGGRWVFVAHENEREDKVDNLMLWFLCKWRSIERYF